MSLEPTVEGSPRDPKKTKKKRHRDDQGTAEDAPTVKQRKAEKKARKEKKKRKKEQAKGGSSSSTNNNDSADSKKRRLDVANNNNNNNNSNNHHNSVTTTVFPFPVQYILAPMVGASELAYRLLCRKYGAQLAYTPMMSAPQFVQDADYRRDIFQTHPWDRPLVCHFSANHPHDFQAAVQYCAQHRLCDAVDLNLGCPQRTAFVGHFGSYLLDPCDRSLVLEIVKAGATAAGGTMPICVKIRLLPKLADTIQLCQQLRDAGASLVAIHGRYRASWERTAAGARDGPAHLDQIAAVRAAVPHLVVVANGNTITYDDVVQNQQFTKADGIMSAEGLLDDPALFLPQYGSRDEARQGRTITMVDPLALCDETIPTATATTTTTSTTASEKKGAHDHPDEQRHKQKRKLLKKLRAIERLQERINKQGDQDVNDEERKKLASQSSIETSLKVLEEEEQAAVPEPVVPLKKEPPSSKASTLPSPTEVPLAKLYATADDKIALALEYLTLADRFGPTTMRTQIFHVRRILKDILTRYQLMEDCLRASDPVQLLGVVRQCQNYRDDPRLFVYDRDKAQQEKDALARKNHEEGKRKRYEARMIRKAKREGKNPDELDYYLKLGAAVPTKATIDRLKALTSSQEQLAAWKQTDHSQHCLAFHIMEGGCQRGRGCCFLHVEAIDPNGKGGGVSTTFDEQEEVAG